MPPATCPDGRGTSPPDVIVVGGSLGGLLAATALRSAGCRVDVYERNRTSLEDRGAGIRIQDHMSDLLAKRAGIDLTASNVFLAYTRRIGDGNEILSNDYFPVQYSSWNTLYKLLLAEHDPVAYHLGYSYVGHTEAEHGVEVSFENGEVVRGDLLVFADGINSSGRASLLPQVAPRYAGYVCWRGMVPEGDISAATSGICGDAFTLVLLQPGHMGIYPMPGVNGRTAGQRLFNYVWYRNLPAGAPFEDVMTDRDGTYRPMSVPPGMLKHRVVEELHEAATSQLPPAAAELVLKTEKPFVQVIADIEVPQMAFGRACLLGDASFGGRPHLGAATAKAAINAWELAESLARHDWDVKPALADWERTQLALGQEYVKAARELGQKLQFTADANLEASSFRRAWPS